MFSLFLYVYYLFIKNNNKPQIKVQLFFFLISLNNYLVTKKQFLKDLKEKNYQQNFIVQVVQKKLNS